MKDLLQNIKNFISRSLSEISDENCNETDALVKLNDILSAYSSNYDEETCREITKTIQDFAAASEIQKNKLLSFCAQFYDPTQHGVKLQPNGEEVVNHAFLKEDDLMKLYRFVKRHTSDTTFGGTVFQVMDNHGIKKASDVYRNVMMSRQDFSRVTDSQCKRITRRIAWQIVIGLHCSLQEADEVLFSAGFIRNNNPLDLVMEAFIKQKNYDILAINEVLDGLGLKLFPCTGAGNEENPFK